MTVVDLTFVCERVDEHTRRQSQSWTVKGQERVMDSRSQLVTPVVIASDAACPECGNTGVADYTASTVYVIPDDDSFALQIEQIREAIDTEGSA